MFYIVVWNVLRMHVATRLIILESNTHLESSFIMLQHFSCFDQIPAQVVSNSKPYPILTESGTKSQKGMPGFHESIKNT